MVEQAIANDAYEYDGLTWIAARQEELATHLGVCRQTINRVLKEPPFRSLVIMRKEHGRTTLIRIGAEQCTTDYQRILLHVWNEQLNKFNTALLGRLSDEIEELKNTVEQIGQELENEMPVPLKQGTLTELTRAKRKSATVIKRAKEATKGAKRSPNQTISRKQYGCLKGLRGGMEFAAPGSYAASPHWTAGKLSMPR